MMKHRKIFWALIIVNVAVLITAGVCLRIKAIRQRNQPYVKLIQTTSGVLATRDDIPKEVAATAQMQGYSLARDGSISDQDLDNLIQAINRGLDRDNSGRSLVDYSGLGFFRMQSAPEAQKQKVGQLCMKVVAGATTRQSRLFALTIIGTSKITSVRSELLPYVQDKDPKVSTITREILRRFDAAGKI